MTSCLPTPEDGRGFRFLQGPLTSPSSALQSAFRQVPFEGSCRVKKGPSSWGHGQPGPARPLRVPRSPRSEEHTSELQSLMRISYAVFCLKNKITQYKLTTIL